MLVIDVGYYKVLIFCFVVYKGFYSEGFNFANFLGSIRFLWVLLLCLMVTRFDSWLKYTGCCTSIS